MILNKYFVLSLNHAAVSNARCDSNNRNMQKSLASIVNSTTSCIDIMWDVSWFHICIFPVTGIPIHQNHMVYANRQYHILSVLILFVYVELSSAPIQLKMYLHFIFIKDLTWLTFYNEEIFKSLILLCSTFTLFLSVSLYLFSAFSLSSHFLSIYALFFIFSFQFSYFSQRAWMWHIVLLNYHYYACALLYLKYICQLHCATRTFSA